MLAIRRRNSGTRVDSTASPISTAMACTLSAASPISQNAGIFAPSLSRVAERDENEREISKTTGTRRTRARRMVVNPPKKWRKETSRMNPRGRESGRRIPMMSPSPAEEAYRVAPSPRKERGRGPLSPERRALPAAASSGETSAEGVRMLSDMAHPGSAPARKFPSLSRRKGSSTPKNFFFENSSVTAEIFTSNPATPRSSPRDEKTGAATLTRGAPVMRSM